MRISDWSSDVCSSDLTIGERMAKAGDLSTAFRDAQIVTADYRVALGVHAGIETMTATAERSDDGLELWMPTLAPGLARAAAAATLGIAEDRVTVHPMLVGGGFGVNLEHQVAEQAALLADRLRSEEHTSELQSLMRISYAVFCLKKKKNKTTPNSCT